MVQGYYTLQEAAQVLGMAPEELKQMAQRNQIRSFQDRGTWRFRVQDIQELARQRGAASDLELVLGEAGAPQATDSPAPKSPKPKSTPPQAKSSPGGPRSPAPKSPSPKSPSKGPRSSRTPTQTAGGDVFDFALDDEHVGVGRENLETPSGRAKARPDSKRGGPPSPPPVPGSDSDVRLVADSSEEQFVFDMPKGGVGDSDVRLPGSSGGKKPGSSRPPSPQPRRPGPAPESPVPKAPKSTPPAPDSGVRLVPMDSDSDVKIVGAGSDEVPLGEMTDKSSTDSDIRLEPAPMSMSRSDEGLLTEEINLDEELKKQESKSQMKPQAKVKPKSKVTKPPASSPFELSESQLQMPGAPAKPDSSDFDLTPASAKPDSSDFDLTPAGAKPDSSDFDLSPSSAGDSSSDDFSLELPDESDISLTPGSSGELKGPSSGISLDNPVDAGISLEQGGEGSDEIEFELSLDAEATPKPAAAKKEDSGDSSEFELSLDVEDQPKAESASDSEFELTLDDSGGLAPLEEAPQLKAGQDKDIFETDFEVPALEEESGSQVAALDTDLDSSDFDLALGDSEVAAEEESGSQVVALDEEEAADEAAATVAAKRGAVGLEEGDVGFEEMAGEEAAGEIEIEEEAEAAAVGGPVREVVREKVLKPAPWGALPVVLMIPCVIVMFMVGIMGFEMVQHMTGYQPPGLLTKTIAELIGQKPK